MRSLSLSIGDQRDEEYFYTTLLPNALQSNVGEMLADDFWVGLQREQIAR
jgi:hypothetical protein